MLTTEMLVDERWRALEDLLQSERELRNLAEATVRELRQVLIETAIRLDGTHLEEMRREDPDIPARWTVHDWRHFMMSIPVPSRWADRSGEWLHEKRELLQQIEALKARLAELQTAPPSVRPPDAAGMQSIPGIPDGMTPPMDALVERTKEVLRDVPARSPVGFSLDGGNRTGGDRARVFPRYWSVLYLIGHFGLAATMEIEHAVADVFGVRPGSGSLRRVLSDLMDAGIIHSEVLEIALPRTALRVARLTETGTALYREVFSETPRENDWGRLCSRHEGETYPEHSMAVLAFTMHARRRGWATRVMPDMDGSNAARPDCQVKKDRTYFVEVELSHKEHTAKWRNLAELNNGAVALCAGTCSERERLVGDCKLLNLHGVATDIETLIQTRFGTAADTPLWSETW